MPPRVDVIIQPFCLRFSLKDGVPIYYATPDPRTQLDGLEELLGIHPPENVIFDCNLGFLPVASTTLIRANKTILVDPNNAHIGQYGLLRRRLADFDLKPGDVDLVVNTHCHHDHSGSNFLFRGKPLVVGEDEMEYAAEIYWPEFVEANFTRIMPDLWLIRDSDEMVALDEGVWATKTAGHTPGSISVLVETAEGRVAVVGDLTMLREEYQTRRFSRWYTPEQVADLERSLSRIEAWDPDLVIPGHDQLFSPR